jgi:hypothetical protein
MGTEKDHARGTRQESWKASAAFNWQSNMTVKSTPDPDLAWSIEHKTNWLSERQRNPEEEPKTFRPISAKVGSLEAMEAYIFAMRGPVPIDEANLKTKKPEKSKEATGEKSNASPVLVASESSMTSQKSEKEQKTNTEPTPTPLFPIKPGIKVASSSLTPGMLNALPENQSFVTDPSLKGKIAAAPNSPVDTFKENLKTNALQQLQQNRIRLDQSQQRFADPDPKNPNWENLRKQSAVVNTLNARERTAKKKLLEAYRNATGDRVSSPFPLLSAFTSPTERHQMVLNFYQQQLGPQWQTLAPQMQPWIDQLYVADALRAGMYAQEPALVVAPGEFQRPNTPENNLILQRRMRTDFGIARGGINRLEKILQTDKGSALALTFDQVVGQTLAGIKDPQQRQQALDWVQQQQQTERNRQAQDTMGLAAATLVAVGASIWGVSQVALIFGGIATFQGGKMSIEGINQAGTNLDALKAGDAGGKRLTAMNPHQAQMDYQMAMVNVGLSLLDAKVAVSSIREVLASRKAVQVLGKLKPNQVDQFAEATKLQQAGKIEESKGLFQKFLADNPGLSKSERETLTRLMSRSGSHEEWNTQIKAYFDEYYGKVGRVPDDVSDLVNSSKRKGITVKEGGEPRFDPNKKTKGTITYSVSGEKPIKRWSYKEEFLHSLVAQSRKIKDKVQPQIDRMKAANKKAAQMGQPLPYSEAEIEQLTPRSLREIAKIKKEIEAGYAGRKPPNSFSSGEAAEEVFVKEWLLKHPKLGEVGESEKILLETQIKRLREHGLSRGY